MMRMTVVSMMSCRCGAGKGVAEMVVERVGRGQLKYLSLYVLVAVADVKV